MRRMRWMWMMLLVVSCAFPARSFAQAPCPWMNAATAGGFLGGDVAVAITGVTADGDATCEFTHGAGSVLRLAVHTVANTKQEYAGYLAMCATGAVPLKGIGNEAVSCMPGSGANKGSELIVGHVRDRVFVITIRAEWIGRSPTSPTKTRNPISDDSENIAEQVAGSMF